MHIPGYQIERELGQGGMAIVYLAMQESLHRHVALKVIKPILTTDEEFAQRFLREGRIIAQLNDPHIVTVYDIASHDNTYYLSMEYLPGGTLQQRIRDGLPLQEALAIARAMAGALHYAHRRNIIHRDIKPQNILFRENGSPVLTDFGIAKTLGGTTIMTRTGLSIGTPRYMSPEQIRGQTVDARADLYSLGVLFHEMLTGNVPYTAEDSFALAMMHVTAPIPELPPKLARFQPLLNKLLDKNPDQRFQNGQEIIAALDAVEAPSGLTGSRETLVPAASHAATPANRLGWKIGIPLAAALTGAVVAGGYLFLNRPATAPPTAPPLAVSPPARPPEPPAIDLTAQRKAEADQLLAEAIRHQQAGALADSLARIEQGLKLVPDHPVLLALRDQVNRQIADEDKARQAKLQAEQFLEQAQRARQEGALDMSLVHIEQGLQAMPDHADLRALKQAVLAERTERQRQQDIARHQAELAERQRTEAERQKIEAAERQKAEAEQRRRKADEFLGRALGYQRDRAYEVSLLQIEQGLQQSPDHPRLLALREEVRRQLREAKAAPPVVPPVTPPLDDAARLAALLKQCEAHLNANRLTSGKGGNAADCYGEVLRRDRGNSEAQAGLDRIADRYADQAAAALRKGDAKATRSALDRLARLNPSHFRLSELRERLAQAEAAARQPAAPPPVATAEPPPAPPEKPAIPTPVATSEPPPAPPEKPVRSAPVATSEPQATPPERPAKPEAPPIDLVSLPKPATQPPAEAPDNGQVIAQDRRTRLSKTETDSDVRPSVTGSPQDTAGEQPPPAPETTDKTRAAEQAWATIKDSGDAAEIERFLATYPKSRQASAARAKLKQLKLQPGLPARLAVQSDVEDAQVTINGRNIGTTPLEVELKPGAYKVRVSREGHQDWSGRVDLAAGDDRTLTAVLPGKLAVATAPPASPRPPPEPVREPEPEPEPEPTAAKKPAASREPAPAAETQTATVNEGSNCLRGNCRNGQGTYRHPDGSEYSGEFRNAMMHGQGTYVYARRGEKYVGEWRNGVINGEGTYFYRSGNRYQGEWRNGRKSGQGTYSYASGEKYVGEFENDQPNGQGTYYYRNGDRYEGEWRNGRKNGQGVMYENGKKIVGEWRDDQKVRVSVEQ
jgi:hypothetical protein